MCITSLYKCRKHIGQHFQNILSGDKESNKKTYNKYKYLHLFAKYSHSFLVVDLVFLCFMPSKWSFLSPEVPEGHKRDKKLSSSSVWGTNGGQNWFFYKIPNWELRFFITQIISVLCLFWRDIWRNITNFIKVLIINNINIHHFPMQHIYIIDWKRFSLLIGTTRIFTMTRKILTNSSCW